MSITEVHTKPVADSDIDKRKAPLLFRKIVRFVQAVVATAVLIAALVMLSSRHQLIPPLGNFLSPFHGVWKRASPIIERHDHGAGHSAVQTLKIPGLKAAVEIQIDRDRITHIFASNDHDLYLAQGFVIASERLWQMDFMSRTASGRLSEVFGERTLPIDLHFTRLGLPQAAASSVAIIDNDPITGPAVEAYTAGVNAFIATLDPDEYPFEYRFLGHAPEEWSTLKVAYLLKFMAWNLAGHSNDVLLTRSFAKIGRRDFQELFPIGFANPEPIIPDTAKWGFESRGGEPPAEEFVADVTLFETGPTPHPSNGSNSWAVTSSKSANGHPILSNDIHLGLSLPSLWYEIQLVSPSQNVYGIALPGSPGVILGFNSKVGWGVTNGGSDVMDWYQLRFRDEKRSEYLFDGQWRPVISREANIFVRGRDPEPLLLRETHFGPLVYDTGEVPLSSHFALGLALKWGVLEPSNEIRSFLLLNRAKTVADCRLAIENYNTPAQNFLCIDDSNTGQWHMGKIPVRWKGQGRLVGDGSNPKYEWQAAIPRDEVPQILNPARGFLSSANQAPAAHDYPHYLGWPFEAPFRAMRINEILRAKKKFTPEDFIAMQGDTVSESARLILPELLKAHRANVGARSPSSADELQEEAIKILDSWKYDFAPVSIGASIYTEWVLKFEETLWSQHFPDRKMFAYPPLMKTIELMQREPSSHWFDNRATGDEVEVLGDLATESLQAAIKELKAKFGSDPDDWEWGETRRTRLQHIGRIPGFGSRDYASPGTAHAIFANTGAHGPVWKLVVTYDREPQAWGIYPGGQSGDPLSEDFDRFVQSWSNGELRKIVYLKSPNDKNDRLSSVLRMTPESETAK